MVEIYTGRLLKVDLNTGKVSEESLSEKLYRNFIGGSGLGARLLYERQPGNSEALGENNILCFMPGLLSGTTIPSSSTLTVVSKSPLTGGLGNDNIGGCMGYELKSAGYDGILFSGISPRPVYLLVRLDKVELRDASHLWGKDTIETEDILKRELANPRIIIASIGPAGEDLSIISSIVVNKSRAVSGFGLGAVMGSKYIKAIVISRRDVVPVAKNNLVLQLRKKYISDLNKALSTVPTNSDGGFLSDTTDIVHANNDLKLLIEANRICNSKGIDTVSAISAIAFAIKCYEQGIITKQETDGMELIRNSESVILDMLWKLVNREGFGRLLFNGTGVAAEMIGRRVAKSTITIGMSKHYSISPHPSKVYGDGYFYDPILPRYIALLGSSLQEEKHGFQEHNTQTPKIKPDMGVHGFNNYNYAFNKYEPLCTSIGISLFPFITVNTVPLTAFINIFTGWDIDSRELSMTSDKIRMLYHLFNMREGIAPVKLNDPGAILEVAIDNSPEGNTTDSDFTIERNYAELGLDNYGYPTPSRLEELSLTELVNKYHKNIAIIRHDVCGYSEAKW